VEKAGAAAILCSQGCGFYGSPATLNMCSMCFRKQQRTPSPGDNAVAASAHAVAAAVVGNAPLGAVEAAAAFGSRESSPPLSSGHTCAAGECADVEMADANESVDAAAAAAAGADEDALVSAANVARPKGASAECGISSVGALAPLTVEAESSPSGTAVSASELSGTLGGLRAAAGAGNRTAEEMELVALSAPVQRVVEASARGTPRRVQKNKGRCFECRKKVGLTGFSCRCGYVYCSEHRHADQHACDFDYRMQAKDLLVKANPVVVASKVDKI